MSRAFVKEPDGGPDEQPELPQSPHPNYVTPTGLQLLEDRLTALDSEIHTLRDQGGDLAAQSHLGRVEREYRYVEERISRAILVDPASQPQDQVAFAAIVTLEEEDGTRHDYEIVGEDEADPDDGKVSYVSPLARALQDAKVGDVVTWKRPAGDLELEVVAIHYPSAA